MGEDPARRRMETDAIRLGVDLGMTLVDTAEMYGEGLTEQFLGEALAGLREEVFLVSKVWPHHATREGTVKAACERSLRRLRHRLARSLPAALARGEPLKETVAGSGTCARTARSGTGGSATSTSPDLEELSSLPGGLHVAANQVLYNLSRRAPGIRPVPWPAAARQSRSWRTSRSNRGGFSNPVLPASRPGTTRPACRSRWPGCCAWPTPWRSPRRPARIISARTMPRWGWNCRMKERMAGSTPSSRRPAAGGRWG